MSISRFTNAFHQANLDLSPTYLYQVLFFNFQGYGLPETDLNKSVPMMYDNREHVLSQGSVVIAAITSCTNTSNPSVMLAAGLPACLHAFLLA